MKKIQASEFNNLLNSTETEYEIIKITSLEEVKLIAEFIKQGKTVLINEFSISSLEILVELTKIEGVIFKEKLVFPLQQNDNMDDLIDTINKLNNVNIEICIGTSPYIPADIISKINNPNVVIRCNVPVVSSKYIEGIHEEDNDAYVKYTFFRFSIEDYLEIKNYVDEIKMLINKYEEYIGKELTDKEKIGIALYLFADSTMIKREDLLADTTSPSKSWLTLINGEGVCARVCSCCWYASPRIRL